MSLHAKTTQWYLKNIFLIKYELDIVDNFQIWSLTQKGCLLQEDISELSELKTPNP